jgi:dihydrofolate synthase/folylpolyglutamate synthase
MNYNECVDYIQNAALYGAKKNNLDNIIELMNRLGSPQNSLKFVHVAGTNGKGSTCAMIESVLRHSGYKTGLFTSPYLQKFTERIRIGGENISQEHFTAIALEVIEKSKEMAHDGYSHPTFFELVTACAFVALAKKLLILL